HTFRDRRRAGSARGLRRGPLRVRGRAGPPGRPRPPRDGRRRGAGRRRRRARSAFALPRAQVGGGASLQRRRRGHPRRARGAVKLDQSFDVAAPIEDVWRALNDLERVAPCLPGATITGHDEDGTYRGEFKVKLGPTTAAYRGTIKITEADEAAHVATMVAKGN